MDVFRTLTGIAAPLPLANIDTDTIIPAPFCAVVGRDGLSHGFLNRLRFLPDGSEAPDFVLNQPAFRRPAILLAQENFGCGSSREHAAWACKAFGIRCLIAPSFADIFEANCFNNGLLPIRLPRPLVELLMEEAMRGANAPLTVDLVRSRIARSDGQEIAFAIDPHRRHCLLEGIDDIVLALRAEAEIAAFERSRRRMSPAELARPALTVAGGPLVGSDPPVCGE